VEGSVLEELVITDSIGNHDVIGQSKGVRHLTIAPLLAEAIRRTAEESSVSSLFD
ncbi:MAG: phosphoribosylpyrophosphate synthetase, partial [Proteobacteria bacterium]|nr:phosphoribosylpyrophosphate synthetase [Pseudomonadota bacterium]